MKETKTISRDTYLKALGLFTLGNGYYTKGREIEDAMNSLLGEEDGSHFSDSLFDKGAGTREFDEALQKSSIAVELETS